MNFIHECGSWSTSNMDTKEPVSMSSWTGTYQQGTYGNSLTAINPTHH